MYFDRFDICEAWYLFLCDYHEGQDSDKYKRLSRLLTIFKPRPSLLHKYNLNTNGREIYDALVEGHRG